ncbi:Annexin [Rhynchospora pubera]|uniref:Annexin n=1 Tax=Rhynchospora pubera TaxID=906938 RepID=A0AAV8BWP4_9POAL|nr:Annexin [Rhynchospora pubera]KAJ4758561.1 Annexin [Rhynchospora pubera]KAJ4799345.1 Annexin [Rhynchospora pubera]KAJ4811012.1 Annexin [Rhynchospora pubera]
MATLTVPPMPTSPRQDAVDLYKAFKGIGCDKSTVINILAHRDSTQRALIQQEYRSMYSEDLLNRIKSELSGHLEDAVLLWLPDPATRDALILKQALSGDRIDLTAATEIICSRTPSQIQTIKQIYHGRYHSYLEHDITRHTSGDHQKLLLSYIGVLRYEGPEVDPGMVARDAKDLYKAGEKRIGTDENTFIHIFTGRSAAHLASVSASYKHAHKRSLTKAVKSETSGFFELGLLTILRCAENPAKYFAKVLHKAMKGLGTNDTTLIRVVVTRAEMDMQYIKAEYHKKHHKSLVEAIHSETSGHYRTFLESLVGSH